MVYIRKYAGQVANVKLFSRDCSFICHHFHWSYFSKHFLRVFFSLSCYILWFWTSCRIAIREIKTPLCKVETIDMASSLTVNTSNDDVLVFFFHFCMFHMSLLRFTYGYAIIGNHGDRIGLSSTEFRRFPDQFRLDENI